MSLGCIGENIGFYRSLTDEETSHIRGGGRSARLVRPFEENLNHTIIGPTKILKI